MGLLPHDLLVSWGMPFLGLERVFFGPFRGRGSLYPGEGVIQSRLRLARCRPIVDRCRGNPARDARRAYNRADRNRPGGEAAAQTGKETVLAEQAMRLGTGEPPPPHR